MRSETITSDNVADVEWDENYFKYCTFANLSVDGGTVCSEFVGCIFQNVEWYWGLFSGSNFIDCRFKGCTFLGTCFPGTRFVECQLVNCRFLDDYLGGHCEFKGAVAYRCSAEGGEGFQAEVR